MAQIQSHSKALQNRKPLKIKHLSIFIKHFKQMLNNGPPSPPTRPADHLTFVKSDPRFFYTLSIHLNMLNKNSKTFENQGLEPLGKSLGMR
jgi:hypothetical protein